MEDAFKERKRILDNITSEIFKSDLEPSKTLLERICLHMELSDAPHRISNIKSIKVNIENLQEKYAPAVRIVESNENNLCLLTYAEIEDRWMGTCGHSFEKHAILDYISKGKLSCPVFGCGKPLQQFKKR